MSQARFPNDIALTAEDFRQCGLKELPATSHLHGYETMWQSLSAAAQRAIEGGKPRSAKALWLLADACSMTLVPAGINEPFKTIWAMDGKRTCLPNDFTQQDLEPLAAVVDEIEDFWLKARIADLLWVVKTPRDPRFALVAIDTYRQLPLDTKSLVIGTRRCLERAVRLSIMLKAGAGNRIQELEALLEQMIQASEPEDGFRAIWLAQILEETRLGRPHSSEIAKKLEALGDTFAANQNTHRAREYFDAAGGWYARSDIGTKAVEMAVRVAESWVQEAELRNKIGTGSNLLTAHLIEKAIHRYRSIPRRERPARKIDERIAELRTMLHAAGERSVEEMTRISSAPIDLTDLVNAARKYVTGKTLLDALAALANVWPGINLAKLRKTTIENMQNYPLQHVIQATMMSRDGRVIAKRPGISMGKESPDDSEAIEAQMINNYLMEIQIMTQGLILPAVQTILQEHRIPEDQCIEFAIQSTIVPPGRGFLLGTGLFAGFESNFVVSTHILAPQLEHLVRWHLKARNVKTTTIDLKGVESELGLSALTEMPEFVETFGDDLSFEIRAVFVSPFGPNLRNQVAHGLLESAEFLAPASIYAWWLCFRIIYNAYYQAHVSPTQETGKDAVTSGANT